MCHGAGAPWREPAARQNRIASIEVATGARAQHTQGDGLKVSPQFVDAERIGFLIKTGTSAGLAITSGERIATGCSRWSFPTARGYSDRHSRPMRVTAKGLTTESPRLD
jgi:hypothetical protein